MPLYHQRLSSETQAALTNDKRRAAKEDFKIFSGEGLPYPPLELGNSGKRYDGVPFSFHEVPDAGMVPAMQNAIEYLKTVDTPTLSNAIEQLGVRERREGFAPLGLQCLFPEFGRMCGYAVTAQVETVTKMEPLAAGAFHDLFAAVNASSKPAIVVLQEIGGFPDFATHCGEVMATIFTRLGAIGVVSDAGVRDIPEVRAVGMHYFARGRVASHASFRIVRSNVAVQLLGLPVRPGDLLHGDENGLITVPDVPLADIQCAVERVRASERALMEYVRGPEFTLEGLRDRFLH